MKILHCLICDGELEVVGENGYHKAIKCNDCGFTSGKSNVVSKEPEVVFIRNKEE